MIRRLASIFVALLFSASLALAGPNGQGIAINGALGTAGQLLGVANSTAALAGNVGEIFSSNVASGSAVSLTSTVAADVTSVTITPGQWLCYGNIATNINAATIMTLFQGYITTTSATAPTSPNSGSFAQQQETFPTGLNQAMPVGSIILNVAANTPVYLGVKSTFSVNTNAAYGYLACARMR